MHLHSGLLENTCKNIYLYKMKRGTVSTVDIFSCGFHTSGNIVASEFFPCSKSCHICIPKKNSHSIYFRMGKFPPGRKYSASCWSCFPAVGLPIRRTEFGRWKHGRGQKSPAVSWRKTFEIANDMFNEKRVNIF